MKIAVVGLGLIGGSVCKAIKAGTLHTVFGMDTDEETQKLALSDGAVDEIIDENRLGEANMTIVCLYPVQTVEFIAANADKFKKGSIVIDICGVKEYIVSRCTPILAAKGIHFIGTHPMAGREFSGYKYSSADLFKGASYIITPTEDTPQMAIDLISTLASCMGFGKVVLADAKQHDTNIAYTSQLAHVVSNAYVKSPTLFNSDGFSAGSFLDLTRVAKLNECMWTDLFICNKTALLSELDGIISQLNSYRDAIYNDDKATLCEILRDGRIRKEKSLLHYGQEKK